MLIDSSQLCCLDFHESMEGWNEGERVLINELVVYKKIVVGRRGKSENLTEVRERKEESLEKKNI